jgi:hypothetical protein
MVSGKWSTPTEWLVDPLSDSDRSSVLTNQYPFLSWSCRRRTVVPAQIMAGQKLSPQGQRLRTIILTVPIMVATSGSWSFLTRPFEAAHTLTFQQWFSTNVSCSESLSVSSRALESATQTVKSSSFTRRSHPKATVSSGHRVYAFWNRHHGACVMYIIYLCLSIHGRGSCNYLPKGGWDGDAKGYFESVGGCWTTRTPAMRAGLNDRSQSAYAAPAPKPVERAMGHARPEMNLRYFFQT